jgi:hypothetical protein
MRLSLLLALILSVTFLTVFLAIVLSQSSYSTPPAYTLDIDGMGIKVGPPPNSTGIPLDTTIIIDALTSASLADFQMTPQVSIARLDSENSSPLTYLNSFYPSQPLKPATFYTVSVIVMNVPVSWSFTTTAEVLGPGIGFYLATNAFWIALFATVLVTLITGYTLRLRSKAKSNRQYTNTQ